MSERKGELTSETLLQNPKSVEGESMNLKSRSSFWVRKSIASALGVLLVSSVFLPIAVTTAATLAPALTPTFSAPVSTSSGFKVNVTNYSSTFTFTPSVSAGNVVGEKHEHSLRLTVTGLTPGASATVTVTTARAGYANGSAAVTGSALLAALVPTFSTPVPTANGFTVNVTNYDAAYRFTSKTSAGHVVAALATGATLPLTVTELKSRSSATVTVTTTRTGYAVGRASVTGTQLPTAALVPTFSTPVPTATGFTVNITNFNPAYTFTPITSAGSVVVGKKHEHSLALSVAGLAPGGTATLTVTTARNNYGAGSASITGTALLAALVPTFSTPVSIASGFTVNVTNYDPAFTYTAKSSQGHVTKGVVNGAILPLSVVLTSHSQVTITVITTRTGYAVGRATVTGIKGPQAALVPTFSAPVSTATGFTVNVTNFSSAFTFTPTTSAGSAAAVKKHEHTLTLAVTGLAPGVAATLTVTTARANFGIGTSTVTGAALFAALVPIFSAPVSTANGFTVNVTNYDPAFDFTAKASVGRVVIGVASGSTLPLTVTGVPSKSSSTITVRTVRKGYVGGRATVTGSAL